MGARRNFSRGGKPLELTIWLIFRRANGANEKFREFFDVLDVRVVDASAKGASHNFKVFCTETTYGVIIFKFQGGDNCSRFPPPSGRL